MNRYWMGGSKTILVSKDKPNELFLRQSLDKANNVENESSSEISLTDQSKDLTQLKSFHTPFPVETEQFSSIHLPLGGDNLGEHNTVPDYTEEHEN